MPKKYASNTPFGNLNFVVLLYIPGNTLPAEMIGSTQVENLLLNMFWYSDLVIFWAEL